MHSLILLRGLPGAGKSTLAKVLADDQWPVFSVDDYFTNKNTGEYEFRYCENHLAYKQCEEETEKAMQGSVAKIFVDNTFTLEWELEPYFKLAKKYNYTLFAITVEKRHDNNNIHGISDEQITKMAEKYSVKLL
jgi:predicted kinase